MAVTGANTFFGRNLIALLEQDERTAGVVALDLSPPPTAGVKTRFYQVDLTRPAVDARIAEILGAEQVDAFVHLAFLSKPAHHTAWAHELQSVGTMHVLNACREQRIRKFVLWSQTILYGPRPSNPNFLTEEHPLHGVPGSTFVRDRIEAEQETQRFADSAPETTVTVLRMAPVLGPTVNNWVTFWLSRRFVPVLMGFDPLVHFLHEMDAVAAFKMAVDRDVPGTFNIVGEGVLPVSRVIKLAGRVAVPVPHPVAAKLDVVLWAAHVWELPPEFVSFLRYLCVADGSRARERMGFRPAFRSREAVLDFEGVLRMKEARLLHEVSR